MHNKVSLPGEYTGFDTPRYTGSHKTSFYIESYDGTPVAADLVLPEGLEADAKIPTILVASRGGRFDPEKGNGDTFAANLIPYGYAAVVFELRGCGASYGTNDSFGNEEHARDVIAVIDWIRSQSWSNGKVGMAGISNRAYIQLCAAAYDPEGLTAITPTVAVTDFYYQNYPNGVSACPNLPMRLSYDYSTEKITREELLQHITPVDDDPDGIRAYEAYETGHFGKNKMFTSALLYPNMNRDTENVNLGNEKTNLTIPPIFRYRDVPAGKIRQHQFIGELESGTLGQLAHYMTHGGSVVMGPWNHFQSRLGNPAVPEGMMDFTAEYHRYYDAALKGADNGFDQAPPVCYYVFGAKDGQNWRYADRWPLSTERRMKLYLDAGRTGTSASVNDGALSQFLPEEESFDEYQVRTDISVFDNEDGKGSTYNRMNLTWDGDMTRGVDEKGLTYTTAPLFPMYDNQITGCVSVDLWVTCDQPDCDFVVYLEEVRADGTSHYLKDGVMRASHRTSGSNPAWEAMGATWHTSMTEDVERCLAEGMDTPVHLQFAIDPYACCLQRGSRIRFTVTCANTHAFQHPYNSEKLPVIRLYRGGDHASFISVPFIEHQETTYNGQVTMEGYEGPGTLYFLDDHIYLYADGTWKKMDAHSPEGTWYTEGLDTVFPGFTFRAQGLRPVLDGIVQHFTGSDEPFLPMPAVRQRFVATVPVEPRRDMLFAPDVKTLHINLFRPHSMETEPGTCILSIHGYGQTNGMITAPLRALYLAGYTIAGIELRNYPSNYFPDYIYDVKGNIRFLRAHAEELFIDPVRIGCYGQSLGGNSTLMAALTGGDPELEGSVGGNTEYSSRLQAAVAGFAWSDLLHMGTDIAEEYEDEPDMIKSKLARTEGAMAPSSEVIGFAGPGKGLRVLREYEEAGKAGTDPELDQKLAQAHAASPLNHITPATPPLCLFGGYGMRLVDIAMKQSLRTFEKLHRCDCMAFLHANTDGEYGQKPEIITANIDFFNRWLKDRPVQKKMVLIRSTQTVLMDYEERTCPVIWDEDPLISADAIRDYFGIIPAEETIVHTELGDMLPAGSLESQTPLKVRTFKDYGILTIRS